MAILAMPEHGQDARGTLPACGTWPMPVARACSWHVACDTPLVCAMAILAMPEHGQDARGT